MSVVKGYHCAYSTHYHIVFPVKYRRALLEKPIVTTLKEVTKEFQERYEFVIERLGADEDHIHILCSLHPKYGPGQFVRLYKSITCRELFRHHPDLKKSLWGGEFWSDGYSVATVGEGGNWKIVEQYVRNQGKDPNDAQLRFL